MSRRISFSAWSCSRHCSMRPDYSVSEPPREGEDARGQKTGWLPCASSAGYRAVKTHSSAAIGPSLAGHRSYEKSLSSGCRLLPMAAGSDANLTMRRVQRAGCGHRLGW